ncbi:Putative diguanylate phosphodiesterase [Vibrio sp. B1FIG11]|uniref:EAL domain-containing protein n=1 Tax=Vibrio sp. B1FIG11 TaxID=2751177 RepID=UPI001AF786CC|nr:EAL domain-containing protein [Vibrio sp. B1FIG11]CAD7826890.1 Putative diguanylate phosphodiesterase [Vibrio sp. B1FIG11]CAE6962008.1 Putative diguanylate phosphodiesterase [Vibrio sp. B1FIG11]
MNEKIMIFHHDKWFLLDTVFQPIFKNVQVSIVAYEALARIYDLSGERVSNEIIRSFSDATLKRIFLYQLDLVKSLNFEKVVSLNIGFAQLEDKYFVDEIIKRKYSSIALEINEEDNDMKTVRLMDNVCLLRERGMEFWMDDYDPYIELCNAALVSFPWDRVKIDKRIVHDYFNRDDVVFLLAILSKFCEKGVIFEGVETNRHDHLLMDLSCYVQGYYYSSPLSIASLSL